MNILSAKSRIQLVINDILQTGYDKKVKPYVILKQKAGNINGFESIQVWSVSRYH